MKLLLLSALVVVSAVFGEARPDDHVRIVGGEQTDIVSYPFMSKIKSSFAGWFSQDCGGTLITETTVLSAAHCFTSENPNHYIVVLGTSYRTEGGVDHAIASIINHEEYDKITVDYDISILKLAEPAVLSNTIAIASIAGSNYKLEDDAAVTAIGWGTLFTGGPQSDVLKEVEVKVVNHDVCSQRYRLLKSQIGFSDMPEVTGNMLCAGNLGVGGKDVCQGDAGGPLVHNGNVVVGITSWGWTCADTFYPSVFTDVSVLNSWIAENTK